MESDNESSKSEAPIDSNSDDDTEIPLNERELFRDKLSKMTFEELCKLKETMGAKEYNKMVFNTRSNRIRHNFKRANKNRPREMSSKRPSRIGNPLQVRKDAPRDPRFDPLCGTYDEKVFKSNYKFLKDLKKKEKLQLEKEYKKEENPDRQHTIKLLMQRVDNQIKEDERRQKTLSNKKEAQINIRKKLMMGEKPTFKKKSEKRIEELISQYEELKKTNKLQKHMERRHKKLAKKDRKNMTHSEAS